MSLDLLVLGLCALVLSLLIAAPLISFLRGLSAKQAIRESGPLTHLYKKSDTPTFGGLIFLIPGCFLTLVLWFLKTDYFTSDVIAVLSVTFIMALLGFTDDFLKVKKKQNKGISGWTKLFIQFFVSILIFIVYGTDKSLFYIPWIYFVIAGATNSYNLTDGLDGLLGGVSLLSFLGFFVLLAKIGRVEFLPVIVIFVGAMLGFLYFNKYPAKIFMGDTGSLAIGGAIGTLAIVTHTELFLAAFATVPIIEAVSVILQVVSCQFSKRFLGKDIRIFKMTPLHHHFELIGWSEPKVVKSFFLFQTICVLIGVFIN